MKLSCPDCQLPIAPADMELSLMIAKCSCGAVFSFSEQVGRTEAQTLERAIGGTPRPATPVDHPVKEREVDGVLSLDVRWFGWKHIPVVVFAVVWNTFMKEAVYMNKRWNDFRTA